MAERRKLVEGLKPVDPVVEDKFVFGEKATKASPKVIPASPPAAEPREEKVQATKSVGRTSLSTRIRTDYATALKRASLERQIKGIEPNTLQDILEEALEPWLRKHDYLE